jgi:acetyl esterase/lipase
MLTASRLQAVRWVQQTGPIILGINTSKFVLAGSSAGGNLAAAVAQRATTANSGPNFAAQILIVPVTDNTATVEINSSWKSCEFTAALPAEKMLWCRVRYIPSPGDYANPEASPLLWEGDWAKLPPVRVILGELDVLRSEGEQYAVKLEKASVKAEVFVMKGMPHQFLAMEGVLEKGREAITLVCEGVKAAVQ